MPKKPLYGIHPSEYEHPLDREALNALQKVSGLDTILSKAFNSTIWTAQRVEFLGTKCKISNKNFNRVYELWIEACDILDFAEPPEIYTSWDYFINASAMGVEKPMVNLTSGSIDLLDDDQLLFIMGHELGHIKSGHMLYYNLSRYLLPLLQSSIPIPNIPIVGTVAVESLKYPLYHWSRMQELTCDRAGLLCCQRKESAMLALISLSGVPLKYIGKGEDIIESFIEQSKQFLTDELEPSEKLLKGFTQAYSFDQSIQYNQLIPRSHPFPLLRVAKLNQWIESGDYQQIIESDRSNIQNYFCKKCNNKINIEDAFCGNCGARIDS